MTRKRKTDPKLNARNKRIARLREDGVSIDEIARRYDLTEAAVYKVLRQATGVVRPRVTRDPAPLVALYRAGATLKQVGDAQDPPISRERVRQILAQADPGVAAEVKAARVVDSTRAREEAVVRARDERRAAAADVLCKVCDQPVPQDDGTTRTVTCSSFCYQAWKALRILIDPAEHVKHSRRVADWQARNPHLAVSTEARNRAVAAGGRYETRGRWFVAGSQRLSFAAECVRRGHGPVIRALTGRQREQVDAYLAEREARR